MRHDGVEVKVTYEGEQLAEVMEALDFDDMSSLTVWFFDDVTAGVRLPLLEAGVVIRLRDRGEDSDATVKLRPCRGFPAPRPVADNGFDRRVRVRCRRGLGRGAAGPRGLGAGTL
jgi:hypothetical protein